MCLRVVFVLSNLLSCIIVLSSCSLRCFRVPSCCFLCSLILFRVSSCFFRALGLTFLYLIAFFVLSFGGVCFLMLLLLFLNKARNHVEFALHHVHLSKFFQTSLQNSMGGRVRVLISGTAPLRDDVMVFLRCALGCHVSLEQL